jgi:two-component system, cell cycle sensor histidine kinase and response regulator CckA
MTAPPFLIDSGEQATAGTPGPIQVLYVDDSPFDRALVRDALERESEGFHLTEASTREEFEEVLARKETFDLVLSDFNILGMTGLEVLARVKELRPGIPVILVTGTGSEEIAVEALKQGASDYVIKQPQHIRRLPVTIRQTLDAWRAREERDRTRERLQQIQRLEAIGRLAGGIAHDFNNLLTVIRSSAELLLDMLETDHPARPEAEEIASASARGGELTRHLLLFSAGDLSPRSDVDPVPLFRETLHLLGKSLPSGIELEVEVEEPLPPLRTNPARLQQVLLNLGLNARDAIEERGRIRVRIGTLEPEACRRVAPAWTPPAEGTPILSLVVEDDGMGMTPEVQARVFEPFFTTKAMGEGSGLGLATAFGTVRQAGGTIVVSSRVGQGSTFTVLLPVEGPEPG